VKRPSGNTEALVYDDADVRAKVILIVVDAPAARFPDAASNEKKDGCAEAIFQETAREFGLVRRRFAVVDDVEKSTVATLSTRPRNAGGAVVVARGAVVVVRGEVVVVARGALVVVARPGAAVVVAATGETTGAMVVLVVTGEITGATVVG